MPDSTVTETTQRGPQVLAKTVAALEAAASRWDARGVFLLSAAVYFVVYLVTVGDISVVGGGTGAFEVRIADDLSRAFASRGFFRFDAIAVISGGPFTYLLSPLNALVALVLSGLVGANLALTYLGVIQPRACGLESSTGVLAGVPALLSGAACCGPTILLVVGVQASATIITGFQLLIPLAVVLLVGGLLLIGRQVDPDLL